MTDFILPSVITWRWAETLLTGEGTGDANGRLLLDVNSPLSQILSTVIVDFQNLGWGYSRFLEVHEGHLMLCNLTPTRTQLLLDVGVVGQVFDSVALSRLLPTDLW